MKSSMRYKELLEKRVGDLRFFAMFGPPNSPEKEKAINDVGKLLKLIVAFERRERDRD